MDAKNIAARLAKQGFTIKAVTQGNDLEDGMVELTPLVHVQVPTYGTGLCVVKQDGESFHFYQPRGSVAALVPDLRSALGQVVA